MIQTKFSIRFALVCAALSACAFGAPKLEEAPAENRFVAKSGDWMKESNWSLKKVPTENQIVILRHQGETTLSKKAQKVTWLQIGSAKAPTTLAIQSGGALEAADVRVWRNVKGAQTQVMLDGGELASPLVSIGACPTISSTGTLSVCGGKLLGRVFVGSKLPNTGTGTLSIEGTGGEIGAFKGRGELAVEAAGTLCFQLDTKGVTPVTMEKSLVSFAQGSQLRVDAARYEGGKKRIPLVLAGKLKDEGVEMQVVAPPPKGQARLVKKAAGIYLEIE